MHLSIPKVGCCRNVGGEMASREVIWIHWSTFYPFPHNRDAIASQHCNQQEKAVKTNVEWQSKKIIDSCPRDYFLYFSFEVVSSFVKGTLKKNMTGGFGWNKKNQLITFWLPSRSPSGIRTFSYLFIYLLGIPHHCQIRPISTFLCL